MEIWAFRNLLRVHSKRPPKFGSVQLRLFTYIEYNRAENFRLIKFFSVFCMVNVSRIRFFIQNSRNKHLTKYVLPCYENLINHNHNQKVDICEKWTLGFCKIHLRHWQYLCMDYDILMLIPIEIDSIERIYFSLKS